MNADDRAGHSGADQERFRGLGNRPKDGPDKRTVALAVEPGMKVVGDRGERKTGIFGEASLIGERLRPKLSRKTGCIQVAPSSCPLLAVHIMKARIATMHGVVSRCPVIEHRVGSAQSCQITTIPNCARTRHGSRCLCTRCIVAAKPGVQYMARDACGRVAVVAGRVGNPGGSRKVSKAWRAVDHDPVPMQGGAPSRNRPCI